MELPHIPYFDATTKIPRNTIEIWVPEFDSTGVSMEFHVVIWSIEFLNSADTNISMEFHVIGKQSVI